MITDHHIVSYSLHIPKPIRPSKKVHYRKLDNINIANFINDFNILYKNITDSSHIDSFDSNISLVLDKHAPIVSLKLIQLDIIRYGSIIRYTQQNAHLELKKGIGENPKAQMI